MLTQGRDSEASAPAEFPPEQPEAELVADGDQYGAEEEAEEAELEKEAAQPGEDAEMGGVQADNGEAKPQNGHAADNDEDEMSEDGSVDLEGESSEDELDEEEEEGAEGASKTGDDAMEVDAADNKPADVQGAKPVSVAS